MKIVFLTVEQARKIWPDKQNQPNQKSSSGERTYQTVEPRHLILFKNIHSELFSKDEREFFKCNCNHLVIEHNLVGKCSRPNCPCVTLQSKARLPISRFKIINWKAIEEKMKPFRFKEKIC